MIRTAIIIAGIVLIWTVSAASLQAQGADRDRVRMAQTYERTGDLRSAARIYQELHDAAPGNDVYFQGVVRTLVGLQQYASLVPLVERYAARAPSMQTSILAGSLHARLGELSKAETWWTDAVERSEDRESAHVMIGQEQMQIGLNAQALASYRAARALNGGSTSYGEEIARLLAVTGDVTGAARETVAMFTADGDLVQVQRRLSVLLATDAGASAIATQLNELPDTYLDVLRLKQWFYRQTKAWRKALDVTEKLDAQGRVRGQELLLFADGARNDEQYDVAVDAYGIVLREVTDERYRMSAAYGAARALDQKLRTARSIGPDEARILVARYDDIITRYGQHPIAAEALYHAAVLEDDVLGERDAARDRLLRVMNAWRGTTTWTDAALRLADMHLAAGRDPDAVSILRSVMVGPQSIVGDRRDLAALRLGDLHLWAGNIDSARSYYAPLASTPSSMAANDAIDRLLLIDLAQDDSATVIAIASAEGLFARRSYGAAGRAFAAAAAAARDNELRDRALFRGATAFVRAADDSSAGPLLQSLVSSVPESIYGDRALFLVAEILQRRGDRKGALQALDAILVNYPRSILVPVARDRIRVLRGDA